jgi:coenzyme Q-binding protein COQ10
MPELHFERRVPFTPAQMLELVSDLNAYPSFVPNCTDMQVSPDRVRGDNVQLARMSVAVGPLAQAYTSRVVIDHEACQIKAKAIDGPFAHLDSRWSFTPNDDGSTKVLFDIDFALSNPLLARAAGPLFASKQTEIVDAFMAEAARRYG